MPLIHPVCPCSFYETKYIFILCKWSCDLQNGQWIILIVPHNWENWEQQLVYCSAWCEKHSSLSVTCASPQRQRQLQWDKTAWLMYKALRQSLIQDDIWSGWSSWQTQTTKGVDLRSLQDLQSRADKSTLGISMSTQVRESLFRDSWGQDSTSVPQQKPQSSIIKNWDSARTAKTCDGNAEFIKTLIGIKILFSNTLQSSKEGTHQLWFVSETAGPPWNIKWTHVMHLEHPDFPVNEHFLLSGKVTV